MRPIVVALLSFAILASPSWAADWSYSTIEAEDGVPLVVAETGNPNGPALLFIHGYSQSILSWKRQLDDPALQAKYRMVAFDLRGHGASGKPWPPDDYESRDWGGDVATVMSTQNLESPVLIGGSVMTDISGLIFAAGAPCL
ncbi:MAG: alpha/beta fold hydrolase [Rhodospirillaceae bacterium]|nr:alpha/beta fold hydrolase [Rhodospirillaceae bacterium]